MRHEPRTGARRRGCVCSKIVLWLDVISFTNDLENFRFSLFFLIAVFRPEGPKPSCKMIFWKGKMRYEPRTGARRRGWVCSKIVLWLDVISFTNDLENFWFSLFFTIGVFWSEGLKPSCKMIFWKGKMRYEPRTGARRRGWVWYIMAVTFCCGVLSSKSLAKKLFMRNSLVHTCNLALNWKCVDEARGDQYCS